MKKLVVANWKMHPEKLEEARTMIHAIEHRMHLVEKVEVVVAAPFLFLPALSHYAHAVMLAAQNMSFAEEGALTGEISVKQLLSWNVKYVLVGHSERRVYLHETEVEINQKIGLALKHKLIPIVCLGGDEKAKKLEMKNLVSKQFRNAIKGSEKKQLEKLVFAYEPTWAISTTKNSKPETGEHATELILHIQSLLAKQVGKERAKNMRILYGGTVNKYNVQQFAKHPEIDGALVGAASLEPENFWEIIKEFNRESIHRS